ncbi:hypothetical protein WJX72_006695 [[Myrmecia] bisecta]|uniref:Uncharacterized protein n=1 Tax=[Myrmecia] bisecta TaxID=41462 RepID=A0AAW1Q9H1_9CHLO
MNLQPCGVLHLNNKRGGRNTGWQGLIWSPYQLPNWLGDSYKQPRGCFTACMRPKPSWQPHDATVVLLGDAEGAAALVPSPGLAVAGFTPLGKLTSESVEVLAMPEVTDATAHTWVSEGGAFTVRREKGSSLDIVLQDLAHAAVRVVPWQQGGRRLRGSPAKKPCQEDDEELPAATAKSMTRLPSGLVIEMPTAVWSWKRVFVADDGRALLALSSRNGAPDLWMWSTYQELADLDGTTQVPGTWQHLARLHLPTESPDAAAAAPKDGDENEQPALQQALHARFVSHPSLGARVAVAAALWGPDLAGDVGVHVLLQPLHPALPAEGKADVAQWRQNTFLLKEAPPFEATPAPPTQAVTTVVVPARNKRFSKTESFEDLDLEQPTDEWRRDLKFQGGLGAHLPPGSSTITATLLAWHSSGQWLAVGISTLQDFAWLLILTADLTTCIKVPWKEVISSGEGRGGGSTPGARDESTAILRSLTWLPHPAACGPVLTAMDKWGNVALLDLQGNVQKLQFAWTHQIMGPTDSKAVSRTASNNISRTASHDVSRAASHNVSRASLSSFTARLTPRKHDEIVECLAYNTWAGGHARTGHRRFSLCAFPASNGFQQCLALSDGQQMATWAVKPPLLSVPRSILTPAVLVPDALHAALEAVQRGGGTLARDGPEAAALAQLLGQNQHLLQALDRMRIPDRPVLRELQANAGASLISGPHLHSLVWLVRATQDCGLPADASPMGPLDEELPDSLGKDKAAVWRDTVLALLRMAAEPSSDGSVASSLQALLQFAGELGPPLDWRGLQDAADRAADLPDLASTALAAGDEALLRGNAAEAIAGYREAGAHGWLPLMGGPAGMWQASVAVGLLLHAQQLQGGLAGVQLWEEVGQWKHALRLAAACATAALEVKPLSAAPFQDVAVTILERQLEAACGQLAAACTARVGRLSVVAASGVEVEGPLLQQLLKLMGRVMWQTFMASEGRVRVYTPINRERLALALSRQAGLLHLLRLAEQACSRAGLAAGFLSALAEVRSHAKRNDFAWHSFMQVLSESLKEAALLSEAEWLQLMDGCSCCAAGEPAGPAAVAEANLQADIAILVRGLAGIAKPHLAALLKTGWAKRLASESPALHPVVSPATDDSPHESAQAIASRALGLATRTSWLLICRAQLALAVRHNLEAVQGAMLAKEAQVAAKETAAGKDIVCWAGALAAADAVHPLAEVHASVVGACSSLRNPTIDLSQQLAAQLEHPPIDRARSMLQRLKAAAADAPHSSVSPDDVTIAVDETSANSAKSKSSHVQKPIWHAEWHKHVLATEALLRNWSVEETEMPSLAQATEKAAAQDAKAKPLPVRSVADPLAWAISSGAADMMAGQDTAGLPSLAHCFQHPICAGLGGEDTERSTSAALLSLLGYREREEVMIWEAERLAWVEEQTQQLEPIVDEPAGLPSPHMCLLALPLHTPRAAPTPASTPALHTLDMLAPPDSVAPATQELQDIDLEQPPGSAPVKADSDAMALAPVTRHLPAIKVPNTGAGKPAGYWLPGGPVCEAVCRVRPSNMAALAPGWWLADSPPASWADAQDLQESMADLAAFEQATSQSMFFRWGPGDEIPPLGPGSVGMAEPQPAPGQMVQGEFSFGDMLDGGRPGPTKDQSGPHMPPESSPPIQALRPPMDTVELTPDMAFASALAGSAPSQPASPGHAQAALGTPKALTLKLLMGPQGYSTPPMARPRSGCCGIMHLGPGASQQEVLAALAQRGQAGGKTGTVQHHDAATSPPDELEHGAADAGRAATPGSMRADHTSKEQTGRERLRMRPAGNRATPASISPTTYEDEIRYTHDHQSGSFERADATVYDTSLGRQCVDPEQVTANLVRQMESALTLSTGPEPEAFEAGNNGSSVHLFSPGPGVRQHARVIPQPEPVKTSDHDIQLDCYEQTLCGAAGPLQAEVVAGSREQAGGAQAAATREQLHGLEAMPADMVAAESWPAMPVAVPSPMFDEPSSSQLQRQPTNAQGWDVRSHGQERGMFSSTVSPTKSGLHRQASGWALHQTGSGVGQGLATSASPLQPASRQASVLDGKRKRRDSGAAGGPERMAQFVAQARADQEMQAQIVKAQAARQAAEAHAARARSLAGQAAERYSSVRQRRLQAELGDLLQALEGVEKLAGEVEGATAASRQAAEEVELKQRQENAAFLQDALAKTRQLSREIDGHQESLDHMRSTYLAPH